MSCPGGNFSSLHNSLFLKHHTIIIQSAFVSLFCLFVLFPTICLSFSLVFLLLMRISLPFSVCWMIHPIFLSPEYLHLSLPPIPFVCPGKGEILSIVPHLSTSIVFSSSLDQERRKLRDLPPLLRITGGKWFVKSVWGRRYTRNKRENTKESLITSSYDHFGRSFCLLMPLYHA